MFSLAIAADRHAFTPGNPALRRDHALLYEPREIAWKSSRAIGEIARGSEGAPLGLPDLPLKKRED